MAAADLLTTAELNYFQALKELQNQELAYIGTGYGTEFESTSELHAMKFNNAMATKDKLQWEKAVSEEHDRMEGNQVWTPVSISEVPKDAKIITSTWAMKKKPNGTFRARLNARGFEQIEGIHYDPTSIAAPVVAHMTIRIVLVLMTMAAWTGYLMDVREAFLKGTFDNDEKIYMTVPQGMEKWYGQKDLLLLQKTIYGLKQAAYRFWMFLA